MSENVRFYKRKMADQRDRRRGAQPLSVQLRELFAVVADCEWRWALEERIEKRI